MRAPVFLSIYQSPKNGYLDTKTGFKIPSWNILPNGKKVKLTLPNNTKFLPNFSGITQSKPPA